jgi:hypothetical protein
VDGTMSNTEPHDLTRHELGFTECVSVILAFLVADFGFSLAEIDDYAVRYVSDCVRLVIRHGRLSYELSLYLARTDHQEELVHPYGIADMLRLVDEDRAQQYRNFAATSRDLVARGLEQLAGDLREFGEDTLRCDAQFFDAMARGRERAITKFGRDRQRANEDTEARTAFDQQDWPRVIEIYQAWADSLNASQSKRLEIARKRATGKDS